MRCSARDLRQTTLRIFLPPLTIIVALLTAGTLLVTATTIVTPPLPTAVGSHSASTTQPNTSPSPTDGAALPGQDVTATLLVRDAQAVLAPDPCIIELARLTYAPQSGGMSQTPPGPWLIVVESGALTVQLRGMGTLVRADVPAHAVAGELTLQGGDGLVLPAAVAATFHNDGTTPVEALTAGVFPSTAANTTPAKTTSARWDASWSPGATVQPLSGGWLIDPPTGPTAIALQRLSLTPGAHVRLTSRGAIVLAVEAGALSLITEHGLTWQQSPANPDAWVEPASTATLLSRDAALLQDQPQFSVRNDGSGPLLLLMLAVTPATEHTLAPPVRQ